MASKNAPTLHQIKMTCRHVIELRKTGMTENIAIRLLEQLTNMYGKFRVLGHVSPDHADQFDHWSKAARKAKAANPKGKHGLYLRVEHGTPRRDFAREVLATYKKAKLTKEWMDRHCKRKWKIAVITHEEDLRLNKLKREIFSSPDKRWAAAKIKF
jgi:hypothetical protein